jgi:dienelactone hydrolase
MNAARAPLEIALMMAGSLIEAKRPVFGLAALFLASGLAACGGGGGNSGSPPGPTGSLTVTECVIAEGDASCLATISWTTGNAVAPGVSAGGITLSSQPSGSTTVSVGPAPVLVVLFDGPRTLDQDTAHGDCDSATNWDGLACRAFATRSTVRAPTPFVENGRPVELEVVLFTPPGAGPFPTVMFNHGSTGDGSDPSLFTVTFVSETVARFFAERGWLVAFPQRRGRGASDGLYDEGFNAGRTAYSCEQAITLAGAARAQSDLDAAVNFLRSRADVDTTRMLVAGTSRGGILSIAHIARRPDVYLGAINFVGGWLGEGCGDHDAVNRSLFQSGATFPGPSLWLYAANDSFYSLSYSRANFDAFVSAGGFGSFKTYARAAGLNGHFLLNDPSLWGADVDAYLGLVAPH